MNMSYMKFKSRQRGISFFGLVFVAVVLGSVGVVAAQIFPTVLEYQAISKAAQKASQGGSVAEVRSIFNKQSDVDDFKSVTSKDIEVTKVNDKIVVSFAYQREIHLVGPGYLLLKYSGQSK
jgi:cytoskeletal protein RodZ